MIYVFFVIPLLFGLALFVVMSSTASAYPAYAAVIKPVTWMTVIAFFWFRVVRRRR